jgi:hypothetical protein
MAGFQIPGGPFVADDTESFQIPGGQFVANGDGGAPEFAVITTAPLSNNTGSLLASTSGISAFVHDPTTGDLVVLVTGLSTDADGHLLPRGDPGHRDWRRGDGYLHGGLKWPSASSATR